MKKALVHEEDIDQEMRGVEDDICRALIVFITGWNIHDSILSQRRMKIALPTAFIVSVIISIY